MKCQEWKIVTMNSVNLTISNLTFYEPENKPSEFYKTGADNMT